MRFVGEDGVDCVQYLIVETVFLIIGCCEACCIILSGRRKFYISLLMQTTDVMGPTTMYYFASLWRKWPSS